MTDLTATIVNGADTAAETGDGRVQALDSANRSISVCSRARAISRPMWLSCIGCVAIVGTWAFWPLGDSNSTVPNTTLATDPAKSSSPPSQAPQPLQLAAFQTPLWVAPIPPPAPPTPPPPPPPLKLQLIAITSGPSEHPEARGALIFDPDQSKLLTVSVGDRIGSRTVLRITDAMVELDDAQGSRQLALKGERPSVMDAPPSRETPP